jgi:NAD(P)-dependent dehydrogenase (short-subunit alcohol dehydrogenase family)
VDLEAKRVLVTGAAGGIGAAIVHSLRERGARVAASDRHVEGIEADFLLPGDLTDASLADGLAQARRPHWMAWTWSSTMPASCAADR